MKRIAIVALTAFALLAAGCTNTKFVYKPSAPVAGEPKLPVKIAVLSFADGTEDFTSRGGGLFHIGRYNLAKAAYLDMIDALPAEFWSMAFADELSASGRFEAVRFVYDRSELSDEAFLVEGTLQKAYLQPGTLGNPNEFALVFRALARADGRPVWEKAVGRNWRDSPDMYDSCGSFGGQCYVDRKHDSIRRPMQEMFAEAGADLAARLAPLAGGEVGAGANPTNAPPAGPAPGSVDETIEGILKGK